MNRGQKRKKENIKNSQRELMPYRDNVACVVFNTKGKVFIGKRKGGKGAKGAKIWQFPQGGIDKGEDALEAAKRELYEETSIKNISLISTISDWIYYDIPDEILGLALKGKYRGQRQKWFAFLFEGLDDEINVVNPANGQHGSEFSDWRWEKLEKTPELTIPFKKQAYLRVVSEFAHIAKMLREKNAKKTVAKKLKAKHIAIWVKLRAMLFPEIGKNKLQQECKKILMDKKQAAFGLFDGDLLVGFAEISQRTIGDGKQIAPIAWLEAIYLEKEYRHKGLSKKLLKKCEKWAKRHKLSKLGSDTQLTNNISIKAHKKWGFKEMSKEVIFIKKLQ